MKKLFIFLAAALLSFQAFAQQDTLSLSNLYTTHVIFETNLSYVDVSNPQIITPLIPENSLNILALMANEPFTTTASVTAIEENGSIKTYVVKYAEHPSSLIIDARPKVVEQAVAAAVPQSGAAAAPVQKQKETKQKEVRPAKEGKQASQPAVQPVAAPAPVLSVTSHNEVSTTARGTAPTVRSVLDEKQGVYHVADSQFGVKSSCQNVLVYSDVVYLVLQLENGSGISYQTGVPTFMVESQRKNGGRRGRTRSLADESNITPKTTSGTLCASPGQTGRLSLCFDKLTLAKGQVLRIYIDETGGQRNLMMTLTARDINRARSL